MNASAETGGNVPGESSIESRLAAVQEAVAEAAERAGRRPSEITLVAVSKTHPPSAVSAVAAAGQTVFGESRVQEARAKIALVSNRPRWHFIGHLQRNKIRHALPLFEMFHGIDSIETARDMDRIAAEAGASPRALIEVNLAGEASKFGFSPARVFERIEELLGLKRITFEGLMCIPPPQPKPEMARRFFVALRELRDRLNSDFHISLPELSMGMSGDYSVAIEEGATLVRVGTAIFGERSGKTWKPQAGGPHYED